MLYKNKNYAFRPLPDFQNGDTIDGGNYSQAILSEIAANLTFENMPNMFNGNLTGENTGKCANVKKDLCYHLNPDFHLGNYPGYQDGDTCGPGVENCRHVVTTNIIETDAGTLTEYIRKDTVL